MSFVPFDEFDQDDKYPHVTSRTILEKMQADFQAVLSIVGGVGVTIDSTDPANPIINVPAIDYSYLKIRTEVPIVVAANSNAATNWADRDIRATAGSLCKIPQSFPVGFTFNMQRATDAVAGLVLDGDDVFEPSFGSGDGVTQINITARNGWISVKKMADKKIAVVGQCVDGTP